jgi:hypothetical protein
MAAVALACLPRSAAPLLAALIAGAALASAHAADPDCEAEATRKALTGAPRAAAIRQCEADAALMACDTEAVEKKLAEAPRGKFIEQCLADTALKNASPACDAQATEKKLAGPARSAFMKRCVAAASGAPAR